MSTASGRQMRTSAPRLADGVELIGEYEGSGFKEPPSLVRRPDGQVIQLPPLLYKVAAKADGRRKLEEIAEEVSADIQRGLDADSVRFLLDEKLRPLGILAAADGSSPAFEKPDPLLGLKIRAAVIPERVSCALGSAFKPLFVPVVVVAALAGLAITDWWLFVHHGVAQSMRQTLYNPVLFLALFAAIVLSAGFHEIGHAAACRYGGGRPGKMGCGLYLAWPAFYTDVTDAYRLGKRARLRTDLGGVYFNVVVVLVTMAAYLVTGFEPLLLLIVFQHIEIAHQLLPVVRLDGYYIVADLTGVPDLFARIRPILRSLVPGRPPDPRVTVLKPWVRAAVTVWVLVVVPLLAFELLALALHLPRILGTAWDSGAQAFGAAQGGFGSGDVIAGFSSALQLVLLALPVAGILLVLGRAAGGGGRWVWRRTDGRPVLRGLAAVALAAAGGLLAYSWLSPRNYEPIQPGEKGTLTQTVKAVSNPSDLRAPEVADPALLPQTKEPHSPTATTSPSTTTASSTTVATTAVPATTVPATAPPMTTLTTTTIGPATTTTAGPTVNTVAP